eukprot:TRINITY_DN7468_c0_g1_i1.p1 TRINITY_DN7468_c0_g1~~TRINITY_DN7468_c0_g1_i1.p1  ORF type:complete len:341 (+),score=82.54 TRINITY_DN7468_c0_g1_i1:50-1072(+)
MSMDKNKIPGVKFLPAHQQILCSSGTSNLNDIIHQESGIPIGSVFLLREFGGSLQYSTLLLKYFLSQGIHDGHQILHCDPQDANKVLRNLPSFKETTEAPSVRKEEAESEDLLIAWRYKNMQMGPQKSEGPIVFDIKATLSKDSLEGRVSSYMPPESGSESAYVDLLKRIYETLNNPSSQYKFTSNKEDDRPLSVLRVTIFDFGSLLYGSRDSEDLKRFIISLKSLCRNYLIVVGLQIQGDDEDCYESLRDHLDSVVDVVDFEEGSNYKKLFKRFHGMISLGRSVNLHRLNLNSKMHTSYLFKSLRNGFAMELMNLPPDFEAQNPSESTSGKMGCQSLEF